MAKGSYTVGDIEDSLEEVEIEILITFKKRKESRKDGESSTGGQEKWVKQSKIVKTNSDQMTKRCI